MVHVLVDVLETVERIAVDVAARDAARVDREGRWPAASIRSLQQEGLGGLVIPARQGGMGQGLLGLAHVCETLAASCPSTAICFGMHQVAAAVIAAKATRDQEERYLAPIVAGEHLTTLALSEPGTGIHFYYPRTRVGDTGETYRLDGQKSFVTNGGHVDSCVVSARTVGGGEGVGEFSCFVVPTGVPGLAWGPEWDGLGLRGNASRALEITDVRIPRKDRLGAGGDQTWYVFEVVTPYFLVAMAGTYLGIGERAFKEAVASVAARRHDHLGMPLSAVELVQHRVGELWARLERTRRLVYWAAGEGDAAGPLAIPALCAAKADVADAVNSLVGECMTLAGGRGYAKGSILGQLLRDARAAHVMSPTTDLLRTWTGRAVLGLPLLPDEPGPSPYGAPEGRPHVTP